MSGWILNWLFAVDPYTRQSRVDNWAARWNRFLTRRFGVFSRGHIDRTKSSKNRVRPAGKRRPSEGSQP